jgi:hypothetical protein
VDRSTLTEASATPPDHLPDPSIVFCLGGCLAGIEVAELVRQKTLERSLKVQKERTKGREPQKPEAYFVWDRADLLRALQSRMSAKDEVEPN